MISKVFHQLLQANEIVDLVDLVVFGLEDDEGGQAGHEVAQGGQPGGGCYEARG